MHLILNTSSPFPILSTTCKQHELIKSITKSKWQLFHSHLFPLKDIVTLLCSSIELLPNGTLSGAEFKIFDKHNRKSQLFLLQQGGREVCISNFMVIIILLSLFCLVLQHRFIKLICLLGWLSEKQIKFCLFTSLQRRANSTRLVMIYEHLS